MVPLRALLQPISSILPDFSQFYMCLLTKFKLCLCIDSIVLVKINTLRFSENPYTFRGRLNRRREVVKKLNTIQIITILFDKLWFHSSLGLSCLLLHIYFSIRVNRLSQVCGKKTPWNFTALSFLQSRLTISHTESKFIYFSMLEIKLLHKCCKYIKSWK